MLWLYFIVGFIILLYIMSLFKKHVSRKKAIGQKVRLEYADHNYEYENILPIDGVITKELIIDKAIFYVIELDIPIKGRSKILIKARHVGKYVGSDKEIDVHLLLPKVELNKTSYSLDDFIHEVWATVKPI